MVGNGSDMRWSIGHYERCRWFAWRPVRTEERWAWLRWVRRERCVVLSNGLVSSFLISLGLSGLPKEQFSYLEE
jgi:hypothetical protein